VSESYLARRWVEGGGWRNGGGLGRLEAGMARGSGLGSGGHLDLGLRWFGRGNSSGRSGGRGRGRKIC
jgi:hypothetical protein